MTSELLLFEYVIPQPVPGLSRVSRLAAASGIKECIRRAKVACVPISTELIDLLGDGESRTVLANSLLLWQSHVRSALPLSG
jgi:hypothetical protein